LAVTDFESLTGLTKISKTIRPCSRDGIDPNELHAAYAGYAGLAFRMTNGGG
jgi:hypothetical protein